MILDDLVDTLVAARLVRKAPRTQAVSFVHRRFNEYFLVSKWLSGERKPPFDAVPTDSRYRDALVLYAEVAGDAEAKALAEFCWHKMKDFHPDLKKEPGGPRRVLRAVHCLRFLTEAFRVRGGPLASFRELLEEKVIALLNETDDLLYQKIAVEASGLLSTEAAEIVLVDALDKNNAWLQEAAFGACRFIQELPDRVVTSLKEALSRQEAWAILFPDKDLNFALSTSEIFKTVFSFIRVLRFDTFKELIMSHIMIVFIFTIDFNYYGFYAIAMIFSIIVMSLFIFEFESKWGFVSFFKLKSDHIGNSYINMLILFMYGRILHVNFKNFSRNRRV